MKLPIVLLAAITAVVAVSSCTKGSDLTPREVDSSDTTGNGGNHPDYCPACGMG